MLSTRMNWNTFCVACFVLSTSTMQKPILYGDEISPPVRFVMMTASFVKVDYKFYKIDLFSGDQKSDFYTKINPLQKVPALQLPSGHVLKDSHAIAIYLCQSQNNKELYPAGDLCSEKSSIINEILFFNASTLFPIESSIISGYFAGTFLNDEKTIEKWYLTLDHIENILAKSEWLAGEQLTLCDICCGATISSLLLIIPLTNRHRRVYEWMTALKEHPVFDINEQGIKRLRVLIDLWKKKTGNE